MLVISNGFGEDHIGKTLINAYKTLNPQSNCIAFPIIGQGIHYHNAGITCAYENPMFPSGGFLRTFRELFTDIKSGVLGNILRQRKALSQLHATTTEVLCVGDIFCLWMASCVERPVYFFPTAKSDFFMPHNRIEKALIRRWATHSFPRDQRTTDSFIQGKIPASFYGNPMMDQLGTDVQVIAPDQQRPIITMLPGSRAEGIKNGKYLLQVSQGLYKQNTNLRFIFAWPTNLEISDLIQQTQWTASTHEHGTKIVCSQTKAEILLTNKFLSAINQANVVIGLAGTANEQAVHIGKPVLCFPGFGPQTTLKRFQEQQQLLEGKLHVCQTRNLQAIKEKTIQLLSNRTPLPKNTQQNAAKLICKAIDTMKKKTTNN